MEHSYLVCWGDFPAIFHAFEEIRLGRLCDFRTQIAPDGVSGETKMPSDLS